MSAFCPHVSFFSCLQDWITFFSLPDGLRHLFEDHNLSSIFWCRVMYDLEASNDTTFRMRIRSQLIQYIFHENIFPDRFVWYY
jgi:hypothetical protein